MRDPPRPDVKSSIAKCKTAGISVIMITGDNKDTGICIAKDVGILHEDDNLGERSIIGAEFEKLSNEN